MLRWAVAFFLMAILAALLGYGGVALVAVGIARTVFFLVLTLCFAALLGYVARRT